MSDSDELPETDKLWGEMEECKLRNTESGPHSSLLSKVSNSTELIECSVPQDPITEHTVQLNKFAKEIKRMVKEISILIKKAQQGKLFDSSKFLKPIDFPPFPKNFPLTGKIRDKIVHLYSENPSIIPPAISAALVEKKTSVEPKVIMVTESPLLTQESHRRLLRKSVAFIVHHAGYDDVDPNALKYLVTCVHLFFHNVLRTLTENVKGKSLPADQNNLLYALDKTFRETGSGGFKGLIASYETRVITKHQDELENCVKLHKTFCSEQQKLEKLLYEDMGE